MKPKKTILLALGILFALTLSAKEPDADFQYYPGGKSAFSLNPVPGVVKYSATFSGETSMKTLVFEFAKEGGAKKMTRIPVAEDGKFNVIFLFKEGPAPYKLVVYGDTKPGSLRFGGIGFIPAIQVTENVPANLPGLGLNSKVLAFAHSKLGKPVGAGECWDLAAEALDLNGADWQRPLDFGKLVNPKTEKVLPGDIIQFRSVKVVGKLPNGVTRTETLGAPDHTAVIYEVLGTLHYKLAHQNIGGQRFVITSELNLGNLTEGEFWIYRPQAIFFPN